MLLDGAVVQSGGNGYVARVAGDGEGGAPVGTGWQTAALTLGELAPTTHTLTIGAYNSQKTQLNETTELLIDEVAVTGTVAGGGGGGGSVTVWLHKNHLGSIQAATDGDGAAALRRGYAPYGAQLWATAATFTEAKSFVGERLDAETGLLYLHARYYDPVMGRFLSADPSDPLQPGVGVNRYAYAGGNPVAYADPYGLRFDEDFSKNGDRDSGFREDYSKAERGWFDRGLDYLDRVIQGAIGSPLTTRQAAQMLGWSVKDLLELSLGDVSEIQLASMGNVPRLPPIAGRQLLNKPLHPSLSHEVTPTGPASRQTLDYYYRSTTPQSRNPDGTFAKGAGGESAATAAGRRAHKSYENTLEPGYNFNQRLPSGRRPDATNMDQGTVRELKPDNPRAIARGRRALERYREELQREYPEKEWRGFLDIYVP